MIKKKEEQKKRGPHYSYTEEELKAIFEEIFERIAVGESLREICRDPKMPDRATINKKLAVDPVLYAQYTKAKELCGEYEFDEIKDIIDAEPLYYLDEKGNRKIDNGWVQLQRLRADKRQWRASKLHARKYGDSTTLKGDAENPLIPTLNLVINK